MMVVPRAIAARMRARPPAGPIRRVLVAHNLLLGDTIMLTPLLAKLRQQYPDADVALLAAPAFVPLYASRPYGVRALPFSPSRSATTAALLEEDPFDLAIVAGDNRYSWLAAAMRARHVIAHAGPRPLTQEWFVDEKHAYPSTPAAWGDMMDAVIEGNAPRPFARGDWPAPPAAEFDAPRGRYAVLHVGASTPLKLWPPDRWGALAGWLAGRGIEPVWSAGRGEEAWVRDCDPEGRHRSYAGQLVLAQLGRLLAGASLVVAPDTGIAHVARTTWAPTLALFGPGSAVLAGKGEFWRDTPWHAITEDPFPCRDQRLLFDRPLDWVRRCRRTLAECPTPRCMQAIDLERVQITAGRLLAG
jgi:ADP-heptose:LPS heptosyltransferase